MPKFLDLEKTFLHANSRMPLLPLPGFEVLPESSLESRTQPSLAMYRIGPPCFPDERHPTAHRTPRRRKRRLNHKWSSSR